ncbi:unnamed protein product [Cylicocyclus nassatus]|uniref:Uncharacterized protein n=1 Tax=Cylicocyclus nassatus TaxID=53992 RepID=A0AA36GTF7_CYLNA|nr:unnamed protein product [Cylicocyclus nassatus]
MAQNRDANELATLLTRERHRERRAITMNPHVVGVTIFSRCVECLHLLQCRRSYCLLSVVNYTADLLIVSWLFDGYDEVVDLLYCIASCLFGIAITSLYLNRPLLMLPDVIYKITVSFCSLFFAIEEVDSGLKGSMYRLLFVLCAVLMQFFENYVLFMALSSKQLEQQRLIQNRPPPAYEQLSAMNLMQRTGEPCTSKPVVPDEMKKGRPETPPPCYEIAMETLKTSKKDIVHVV